MEDFIVQLIARLDTSKTPDDLAKIQDELNKKGVQLKPVFDTATSKKEIQNLAKQMQEIMGEVKGFEDFNTKDWETSINSVIKNTQKATKEQEKLNNSMGQAREKAEQQRVAEEKRQQLAQNNAINKNLEEEYKQRQKLLAEQEKQLVSIKELQSSGSLNLDMTKTSFNYENLQKLGVITDDLKSDFSQLKILYDSLGTSTSNEQLISSFEAFNNQLTKVNNSIQTVKISTKSIGGQLSELDVRTFKNQLEAWKRVNSNATQFHGRVDQIISQLSTIDDKSGLTDLKRQFRELNSEADALGVKGKSLRDTLTGDMRKFTEWLVPSTLVMGTINETKDMIKSVKNLDDALVDLRKTSDATNEELREFYYSSPDIARDLGVNTKAIIEATSAWSRLGLIT